MFQVRKSFTIVRIIKEQLFKQQNEYRMYKRSVLHICAGTDFLFLFSLQTRLGPNKRTSLRERLQQIGPIPPTRRPKIPYREIGPLQSDAEYFCCNFTLFRKKNIECIMTCCTLISNYSLSIALASIICCTFNFSEY